MNRRSAALTMSLGLLLAPVDTANANEPTAPHPAASTGDGIDLLVASVDGKANGTLEHTITGACTGPRFHEVWELEYQSSTGTGTLDISGCRVTPEGGAHLEGTFTLVTPTGAQLTGVAAGRYYPNPFEILLVIQDATGDLAGVTGTITMRYNAGPAYGAPVGAYATLTASAK